MVRLCNGGSFRYPARMDYPHTRPLISRLRASTRLVVMVLLVFLMKVGMVVACSASDIEPAGSDGMSTLGVSLAGAMDDGPGDDSKSPDPLPHASCVDCHCHHAAALTPETASLPWAVMNAEPAGVFVHRRIAPPRRELRPPIA